jgi:hypothetical protein
MVSYFRASVDERQNLLGHRRLERGHGALLTGPSGIGKSTAVYQMQASWACGQPAFAISPAPPTGLRITAISN